MICPRWENFHFRGEKCSSKVTAPASAIPVQTNPSYSYKGIGCHTCYSVVPDLQRNPLRDNECCMVLLLSSGTARSYPKGRLVIRPRMDAMCSVMFCRYEYVKYTFCSVMFCRHEYVRKYTFYSLWNFRDGSDDSGAGHTNIQYKVSRAAGVGWVTGTAQVPDLPTQAGSCTTIHA